jgi:hypothetical protein
MSTLIPFRYAVVQFHRNPVRGEPFNLGLLVVSGNEQAFVRFEANVRRALKLDLVEYRVVDACLTQLAETVQKNARKMALLDQLSESYTGKIQLTQIRGGLAEDVQVEAESLYRTFVAHTSVQQVRVLSKTAAKDLRIILSENKLLGTRKVQRNYTIGINEADQIKMDFGYRFNAGHVAIEAIDLTLPGREERLEEVGPATGKFQFLGDKMKNVRRLAAVKTNGVDASWELKHIKDSSDEVFDIEHDVHKLVGEIEQHLASGRH